MNTTREQSKSPWRWVPSLYFAEGLPYVTVMSISVILFKRFGLSNTDIAFYSSWLYLPWTLKFLWSPLVDLLKTKRWWIVSTQLIIGATLAGVALSLPTPHWFQASMAFFWLMAFSSATHDIAADGFYMLDLSESKQAFFIGIRNTFYRLAMITGQGLLVILAGILEKRFDNIPKAWTLIFYLLAAGFFLFGLYHAAQLPKPSSDAVQPKRKGKEMLNAFWETFFTFFKKKGSFVAILFILFYRFSEAQLVKLSSPFLLDERSVGGLGLSTTEVGSVYGVVGVAALVAGGLLGGIAISRNGLRFWLWPMALLLSLPNFVYVYFAWAQPVSHWIIYAGVALEQFGYGFGFTAFTMFMMLFSKGKHQTAHYALCTAIMALGMMFPGMLSGAVQAHLGYLNFFLYIGLSTLVTFFVVSLIRPLLREHPHKADNNI